MGLKKTVTAASLVHEGHPVATQAVAKDFAWLRDSTGSETQTMYFHLENGTFGFIQIAWAYVALTTTIETNAMFYAPGHPCVFETHNGHNLKVHKDSYKFECKGISMEWNDKHDKLSAKYTAGRERKATGVIGNFEFTRTSHGYKIGDGNNHLGDGIVSHHLYPCGTIKATYEVGGERFSSNGVGLFIHAHSGNIMPYNVGTEWNMTYFTGCREGAPEGSKDTDTFHLVQYLTPENLGSVVCSQAALTQDGSLKAVFWDNKVENHDYVKDENGSGYEVPKRLVYTVHGRTVDGKDAKLVFDARPGIRLHDIDVLGEMPYVLRRLVQALITKPFIFERYEENALISVEIEGEKPYTIKGVAFHELTLMQ